MAAADLEDGTTGLRQGNGGPGHRTAVELDAALTNQPPRVTHGMVRPAALREEQAAFGLGDGPSFFSGGLQPLLNDALHIR